MKHALYCVRRATRLAELWLDDAPGERRAALVEDGQIVEIHIKRAGQFAVGEVGAARIDSKTKAGAYLTAEDGRDMLVRRGVASPEGGKVVYQITRAAIAEPGLVKLAEARLMDELPSPLPSPETLWEARLQATGAETRRHADISEGFERQTDKEFIQYLFIAKGSVAELRTQLYLSVELKYIDKRRARVN